MSKQEPCLRCSERKSFKLLPRSSWSGQCACRPKYSTQRKISRFIPRVGSPQLVSQLVCPLNLRRQVFLGEHNYSDAPGSQCAFLCVYHLHTHVHNYSCFMFYVMWNDFGITMQWMITSTFDVQVLGVQDCSSIYRVPLLLEQQGILQFLVKRLAISPPSPRPEITLHQWRNLADR